MTDFSKLPVGTKVFSVVNGWGTIKIIEGRNDSFSCVKVDYGGYFLGYSAIGHYKSLDKMPELYLEDPFEKTQWQERKMEVSDDGEYWIEKLIYASTSVGYISGEQGKFMEHYASIWKYAREIETLQLTHDEAAQIIAEAKECHPSQIKFVS